MQATPGPCGWSEEDRGRFLAAEDLLRGKSRLTMPQGVHWPAGYEPHLGVISGAKFNALAESRPELANT